MVQSQRVQKVVKVFISLCIRKTSERATEKRMMQHFGKNSNVTLNGEWKCVLERLTYSTSYHGCWLRVSVNSSYRSSLQVAL